MLGPQARRRRAVAPSEGAERLLAGADNEDVAAALDALVGARTRGFAAIDEWICRAPAGAHNAELEQLRRRLVAEAAAARARGVALQHAERLHGDDGARWVAYQLYGGPWPTQTLDEGMEELLSELVEAAREVARIEVRPAGPADGGESLFVTTRATASDDEAQRARRIRGGGLGHGGCSSSGHCGYLPASIAAGADR